MSENGEYFDDQGLAEFLDQGQTDELVLQRVKLIERDFEIFLLSHEFSFEVPNLPDFIATPVAVDNFIAESVDDQAQRLNRALTEAEVKQMDDRIKEEVFILYVANIKDLIIKQDLRA